MPLLNLTHPDRPVQRDSDWHRAYRAYLTSDAWAARRAATVARAGSQCERCSAAGPLEVHHLTYARLVPVWRGGRLVLRGCERPTDLQALCPGCHCQADAERAARCRAAKWQERRERRAARRALRNGMREGDL